MSGNAWGWKLATDPDDVRDFLNGQGRYRRPVKDAKISVVSKGTCEFYVFYQPGTEGQRSGNWGWKLATDPDDVHNFLNGLGAYRCPVEDVEISAVWQETHSEFYVFYRPGTEGQPSGRWGWKLATDRNDALDFLNGRGSYRRPVNTARIAAVKKDGHRRFYIYYQAGVNAEPIPNWQWKKATDPDDVKSFLSGEEPYARPVKGAEICAMWEDGHIDFYVFHNKGTKIWVQSPVSDERFVSNEVLEFKAVVTSDLPVDGSQLQWVSNIDGDLGSGPVLEIRGLSAGNHTIEVVGYGQEEDISVRVFEDLSELYQSPPSQGEIDRIMNDFTINWIDGDVEDERWETYEDFQFDQESTTPSKIVAIAKLDILRHQRFSEPLPFTSGKTIYDHLRTYVNTVNLELDCYDNTGGGGAVSLNRNFSVWDMRRSGTTDDPAACKVPFENPALAKYVSPLYLLVHEGRHNEPDDPGHTTCDGKGNMDRTLEGGSGHAWAAMYLMWVYKYGRYDPSSIREEAKALATGLLERRFCSTPTHSDPKVQAIVDELLHE